MRLSEEVIEKITTFWGGLPPRVTEDMTEWLKALDLRFKPGDSSQCELVENFVED